ncbi:MAG: helix-turn-helix domain-containing protein [Negativicutes bacterium]|nr:helix-turn-helix domain-containing protein [Negativicutes bacterium]
MARASATGERKGTDSFNPVRTVVNAVPGGMPVLRDALQVQALDLEIQCRTMQDIIGELEYSRNRYAALYDFAPISYATFDDKGCISEINLHGASLLGMERAQLIGLPMIIFVAESSKKHFLDHLRSCRLTGETVITELQLSTQKAVEIYVQLISTPLPGTGSGQPQYTTVIADITALKNSEAALKKLNVELESRVLERTHELQNTNKILQTTYKRKRRNDLLNDLIHTHGLSKQKVYETALQAGLSLTGPLSCFLLVIEEWEDKSKEYWQEHFGERQFLLETMINLLEDEKTWLAWESSEGIGVLYLGIVPGQTGKNDQVKLAEQLREKIANKAPNLTISVGIAELVSDPVELGMHYQQSHMAVTCGRKIWPERKIYHYLDMGVLQIVPLGEGREQITAYIERTLGKLIHYDRKKNAEYLLTLELMLENSNLNDVAKKAFIHQKTVLQRKRRIEQILEVSLDSLETRMALATALKMLKLGMAKTI